MSDDVLLFPGHSGVDPGLLGAVEAILFASEMPLSIEKLAAALPAHEPADIREALKVLQERYEPPERGLELAHVGGRWFLRTKEDYSEGVKHVVSAKPIKLSKAAMEALAVIAWEQPATKGDVDRVRGVDSGGIMRRLLDLGLLRVAGRRQIPGRPLEYRTTRMFLQVFSLPDLGSLPTLSDAEELGSS